MAIESCRSSSSSSSSSSTGYSSSSSASSNADESTDSPTLSPTHKLFTFKCDLGSSNHTFSSPIARIFPTLFQTPLDTPTRTYISESSKRRSRASSFLGQKRRSSSRRNPSATRSSLLTRCSELWFNDGNIVLIAEQQFAFKVHRGVLARHSEVFADMFGVPQPMEMEVDADLEGCQHVEMPHDLADDIYHFLKSIYDGLYFMTRRRSSQFPSLSSVLRLSTKYIAPVLHQRCMDQLSADWPTTLDAWDTRESEATDERGVYLPRESSAHPVVVIELANEMGLVDLLPSAFYDLSRYGPSKILVGAPGRARLLQKEKTQKNCDQDLETSKPVTLTEDLFVRTLQGREQAQRFLHSFIMTHIWNRAPSVDCFYQSEYGSGGRACQESFYFITLNVLRAVGGIACGRDADPLFTLRQAVDMLSRMDFIDGSGCGTNTGEKRCGLRLCGACKADFTEACGNARKHVWMQLPEWFGLQDVIGGTWGTAE
ncbi:hypothetical protein E1B28_007663 [Marasmius oreades]|uniref:BTB domain-containing protein n=1 Tax=Marasmius oreades TaxID=181124 RepID=A0A9P7S2T6_9AGAR|nr:uncharacterized protein E1B28_007663 [Marasmius oreades]KAG7094042.1 hypothetical protein E1B28_007663 [Marasmius oreades]